MNKKPQWFNVLCQKKMLVILGLGFASGLPLGLSGSTLQAWYAVEGVDIVTIGFLALVGQPYVYKFLWSPLVDRWRFPFLGLRRGWVLVTQLALMITLCFMALLSPKLQPYHLAVVALGLAFFSATQDIAVDAYRTELLLPDERGLGSAMATVGYRIAMLVSTGLTLILAHYLGFSFTYFLMALLMAIGLIVTLWSNEPSHYPGLRPTFIKAWIEPFKEFFSRRHAIALLILVVLYKIGDAFAGSLVTAFLLKGVGFSLRDIGLVNKMGGLIATVAGAFVGGALMVRLGLFRALLIFGIIQALTNFFFLALSMMGTHYGMLILTVCAENFGSGLGTAAFMGLVMSLCNPRYTATQFALISALAAIGRVFVGPFSGMIVNQVGWTEFFAWTVVFAMPSLILLWCLRRTIQAYDNRSDESDIQILPIKANA
jgi:PAT family beta-lactamase induction signal transducer AmpG